jgi:hypothetical protein
MALTAYTGGGPAGAPPSSMAVPEVRPITRHRPSAPRQRTRYSTPPLPFQLTTIEPLEARTADTDRGAAGSPAPTCGRSEAGVVGGGAISDRHSADARPCCIAATAYTGGSTPGGAPPSYSDVLVTRPTTCQDPSGRSLLTL